MRKGLIRDKLNSYKSAGNPSLPGADFEFNETPAASNSQSEIRGGYSSGDELRAA